MECPHCHINFHLKGSTYYINIPFGNEAKSYNLGEDADGYYWIESIICPACLRIIIVLIIADGHDIPSEMGYPKPGMGIPKGNIRRNIIQPKSTGRPPVPPEVPDEFKRDYQEACLVLADSPNASAALSRRCLQFILRGKLGAQGKDLYNQIDWAIKSENLSSSIIELLDVPRKIGNRAVHPTLSYAGMIVDVEPWEAEWCLEVIEALYDHIFVIPARNRERLERLGRALKIGPDDELLENIPRS